MSSRNNPVKLSPRARQDFIDILRYTGETWGVPQLDAYESRLRNALGVLGDNPLIGKPGRGLPGNYRLYYIGAHVIVYRIEPDGIGVARILHQRMQLADYLPDSG